jgi:Zn finger protein HypA/HybF involved in hydrogenase expression
MKRYTYVLEHVDYVFLIQSGSEKEQLYIHFAKYQKKTTANTDDTRLSDEKIITWCRVTHDLAASQVTLHGTNIHNTGVCVKCNYIDTLLHRLTNVDCILRSMAMDTSLYCHGTADGERVCPPAVASTP